MDNSVNASEPVEVWLLESPRAEASGSSPSSVSLSSERKKKRGNFFSKLFHSTDTERNGRTKHPKDMSPPPLSNTPSASASAGVSHDDNDEFLPDELRATMQTMMQASRKIDDSHHMPDSLSYSADQVQAKVDDALNQAHEEWKKAQDEQLQQDASITQRERTNLSELLKNMEAEVTLLRAHRDEKVGALAKEHEKQIDEIRKETSELVACAKLEIAQQAHEEWKKAQEEQLQQDAATQLERTNLSELLKNMEAEVTLLRAHRDEKVEALSKEHENQIDEIRKEASELVARAKSEAAQQAHEEWKKQHEEQLQQDAATQLERTNLSELLKNMEAEVTLLRAYRDEKVEALSKEHEIQIDEIRKEASELVVRAKLEAAQQDSKLEASSKEAKERTESINRLHTDVSDLRRQLDENIHLLEESNDREKSLLIKIASLEVRTEANQSDFERQLIERQDLTNKEIEETIAQLDLLVAEHNQEKSDLEKSIHEKDAIIAALGAQLAEADRRMTAVEEAHFLHIIELDAMRREAAKAHEATDLLKATVEYMKADHKKAMEAEHAKRRQAQDQVREETIAKAESQFQRASEMYNTLKEEYKASCLKISKLELEVKNARSEVERNRKEQASKELELSAELAHIKSRLATTEADAARQINDYAIKLDQLQGREKELMTKLDEAHSSSRTTHMTLAAVVAEKERYIRENEEVKAVCEELMAMIETQQLQSNIP